MSWYYNEAGRLGQIYSTRGVNAKVPTAEQFRMVNRHLNKDWGEVCEEDKQANEWATKNNGRVLSAYIAKCGVKVWVITEADRNSTTILLPEEY